MSHHAAVPDDTYHPSSPRADKLPLTAAMIVGIAGLFLFMASQICIVTAAAIWAFSAYLHFGTTATGVLAAILAPPALYACWRVFWMAIAAERDPDNN